MTEENNQSKKREEGESDHVGQEVTDSITSEQESDRQKLIDMLIRDNQIFRDRMDQFTSTMHAGEQSASEAAVEEKTGQESDEQNRHNIRESLEFAKYCYEAEERRDNRLSEQANQILTVASICTGGLMMFFDLLHNYTDVSKSGSTVGFGFSIVILMIWVMVMCLCSQIFPLIIFFINSYLAESRKDFQFFRDLLSLRKKMKSEIFWDIAERMVNHKYYYLGAEWWTEVLLEAKRKKRIINYGRTGFLLVAMFLALCALIKLSLTLGQIPGTFLCK